MVLFHGTNEKSGEAIIKDGMLRSDCIRKYTTTEFHAPNGNIIDLSTTNGFVYLTNWIPRAVRFGYTSCWDEHNVCSGKIYVFCINVPESNLQADLDEIRMRYSGFSIYKSDYKQSLDICQCVRIDYDLPLDCNSKLLIVPATNEGRLSEYSAVCNYMAFWNEHKATDNASAYLEAYTNFFKFYHFSNL